MSAKNNSISQTALEKIKTELLAQKDKLMAELKKITGETGNEGENDAAFPDFGDKPDENAQEIEGYTTNLATKEILENNLRDIQNSLKRMENGIYGICKYCGKEIGEKRLLARPVASACIECKTKLQSGQM